MLNAVFLVISFGPSRIAILVVSPAVRRYAIDRQLVTNVAFGMIIHGGYMLFPVAQLC